MVINIVFPVLNEDSRLKKGLAETVRFLDSYPEIDYRITIADNGSDLQHQNIARELCNLYEKASYLYIPEKGVGGAFQAAIAINACEIIGYMDSDLATPPTYLLDVVKIFDNSPDIKVINASRLLKISMVIGRKLIREITSRGLNILIRAMFKIHFTDAMCGFKFFRKEAIENISKHASNDKSWFYCAELLIWAEQLGYTIFEIPVEWRDDPNSKVKILELIKQYLCRIYYIRKNIKHANKLN